MKTFQVSFVLFALFAAACGDLETSAVRSASGAAPAVDPAIYSPIPTDEAQNLVVTQAIAADLSSLADEPVELALEPAHMVLTLRWEGIYRRNEAGDVWEIFETPADVVRFGFALECVEGRTMHSMSWSPPQPAVDQMEFPLIADSVDLTEKGWEKYACVVYVHGDCFADTYRPCWSAIRRTGGDWNIVGDLFARVNDGEEAVVPPQMFHGAQQAPHIAWRVR